MFSLAGLINAIFAGSFDDISIIPTFVLTPLIYLGGVFYSIDLLGEFWGTVSLINPILYMVNAFRYGMVGITDIDVTYSFAMVGLFSVVMFGLALRLLETGLQTAQLMVRSFRYRSGQTDWLYADQYDASLLYSPLPAAKRVGRMMAAQHWPFVGMDLWTAFEISWLNPDGLPQMADRRVSVSLHQQPAIVESKSFKLYLNSFIQTQFESMAAGQQRYLIADLTAAVATLSVEVDPLRAR